MHLPSNCLISACSLVNHIWHRVTRTALRDHGQCLANISSHRALQHIRLLEQFCAQLREEGRVVPFNGLRIYNCVRLPRGFVGIDSKDLAVYGKIMRLIKLKHLEVEQAEIALPCAFQYTIMAWLLSGTCSHLQSMNIKNPVFLAELFYANPTIEFPQLETISIPNLPYDGGRECIKRLLRSAPNLKRILVPEGQTLNDLPSDKYNLLFRIPFQVKTAEQEELFRKIVEAEPKLGELQIIPTSAASDSWEQDEDEDSVDPAVQERSDKMLERLLQTCYATLESICNFGLLNPLGRLSFPPLINLTKITIVKWRWTPTGSEKFWRDISSIDYRGKMPRLEEIEIQDTARRFPPDDPQYIIQDKQTEWPTSSTGPLVHPQCSSNASKLALNFENKHLNLIPIQSMAPDVTWLELKISHTFKFDVDVAPFSDIWKLWPQLVGLRITVSAKYPNRNYDADFCGIYEEEAEILREKDANYLRNVHIVPVRPSILTMTSKYDGLIEFNCYFLCQAGPEHNL